MPFLVMELDPRLVSYEESAAETNADFVYEHMRAYCATFDPLPAIKVAARNNRFECTSRAYYVRIANHFERPAIRAIFDYGTEFSVDRLLDRIEKFAGFYRVVSRDELEREDAQNTGDGWHVFFLENPITLEQQSGLRKWFEDFMLKSLPGLIDSRSPKLSGWRYDGESLQIALRIPTPRPDYNWPLDFGRAFNNLPFGLRFVSYQGWRLPR